MTTFFAGEQGYGQAVAGFQTAVRHRPAVVVAAELVRDVVDAVALARDRGLTVAVQATGHGARVAADGVLVTTGRMAGVHVDPVARTASVEAGARWSAVIEQAAAHGLAPLAGSVRSATRSAAGSGCSAGPMATPPTTSPRSTSSRRTGDRAG